VAADSRERQKRGEKYAQDAEIQTADNYSLAVAVASMVITGAGSSVARH
jgi:hypothetical protein